MTKAIQQTDFQIIGEETKSTWDKYWEIVAPYRAELWNFCRKITGSPWDAEDLLQDTLLKTFASLSALSHRAQPLKTRSYLFRVATNHWIDQCRKNKVVLDDYDDEKVPGNTTHDSAEVDEAIETLVSNLPPKQVVVFILMNSFRFTAKETAELMVTTEGAVHALLHRARTKLSNLQESLAGETVRKAEVNQGDKKVIQAFVKAFNRRDFHAIASLLDDHAVYSFHTQSSKEYGKETIMKFSLATTFRMENVPVAEVTELWGAPVILFMTETKDGKELNEVNRLVSEDGKIVGWSGYYFCRELMQAAAEVLGVRLEPLDESYLI